MLESALLAADRSEPALFPCQPLNDDMLTVTSIIDGLLAGAAWTIVAFYSRSRYQGSIPREPDSDGSQQAFGRYQ